VQSLVAIVENEMSFAANVLLFILFLLAVLCTDSFSLPKKQK
jgi:hypothetical protein